MDINKVLNNPHNMYYGHGTGTDSQEVTNSIIKNGLRCSHGSLYYTSVPLGIGTKIKDSEKEMMKKWPHKESNIIIVVSLPLDYKIIDSTGLGTYNMADAAFYYIPDKKTREYEELTNSPYVIPEFIVGYYDAQTDSFIQNPKYYERLSQIEQDKLFRQVKYNYFDIIEEGCGIDKYQEVLADLGYKLPLTAEEVKAFKKQKKEQELLSKIGNDLLKKELILPNGSNISTDKYIREIVFPFIPLDGSIVLKNGNKLPVSHFIIECVLYDCQERYNGDFSKYLEENVDIEQTNQINNTSEKDIIKR